MIPAQNSKAKLRGPCESFLIGKSQNNVKLEVRLRVMSNKKQWESINNISNNIYFHISRALFTMKDQKCTMKDQNC